MACELADLGKCEVLIGWHPNSLYVLILEVPLALVDDVLHAIVNLMKSEKSEGTYK